MIYTKKINQTVEIPEKVTCDFCKKVMKINSCDSFAGASFQLHFGYGSRYDTEIWGFDICDDCVDKHLKNKKSTERSFI